MLQIEKAEYFKLDEKINVKISLNIDKTIDPLIFIWDYIKGEKKVC